MMQAVGGAPARQAGEYICNQCGAKYTSLDGFQTHLKTHLDTVLPKLTCPQCNKEFPNQESLLKHVPLDHYYGPGKRPYAQIGILDHTIISEPWE